MRWNHKGVTYRRGNYETLIARYDGTGHWYVNNAMQTQQSMKSNFKKLGEYLGAKSVEVKPLFDCNDNMTEKTLRVFMRKYDGTYVFREETEG